MATPETILVVLLSAALLLFLILSIVAAVIFIRILRSVNKMAERAEEATASLSDILKMVGKTMAPVAFSGVVAAAMRRFKNKKD